MKKKILIKTDFGNGHDLTIKSIMKKLPNGNIKIISSNIK